MPIFRFLKRKWLLSRPFPDSWQQILEKKVPYYQQLPVELQATLRNRIVIFMDEKLFEGCGGLKMTKEKKLIISAYACVLLLGETSDYYADLQSILVYPDDYRAPVHEESESGIVTTGTETRKGEFWNVGSIVLSWNDLKENIYEGSNRNNIVFHEFAHHLDEQYGLTAGVNEDGQVFRDDEWTNTFAKAFRSHQKKTFRKTPTVLDPYGAEHPVELFAVATESFFLEPSKLQHEYPELYKGFVNFYNIDPSTYL